MATLSDTPTHTMLTSSPEASGVSIKIEQGVLPESDEYTDGSGYHIVERRGIQTNAYESSTTGMESFSNGMGGNNFNAFPMAHSIFQDSIEIKAEPSVDIDDRHPEIEDDEGERSSSLEFQSPNSNDKIISPKIRLTPTSKLIATPSNSTDNKRRYACPYENCTKSYGKSSHLRSHLTWHTGIKPFVCKEPGCGKGFTRSDELNRHIRTHTGEKPFECVQCTKKFSRSDHLTKHLATHTKQLAAANELLAKKIQLEKTQPHQSSVKTNSPVTVPTIISIRENVILNNAFCDNNYTESNVCEEVITDEKEVEEKTDLKIKQENPDYDDKYVIAPNWERTEINNSPASHIGNANIKMEVKKAHNQSYEEEPDDDAIMPEANLPPLIQMPAKVETLVKPSGKNLTNTVYDPTRPHACTHCTKSFKRQDDLNRHMRTHTGEKPFACSECDKRFMRSDHLKKHINTHTRSKKTKLTAAESARRFLEKLKLDKARYDEYKRKKKERNAKRYVRGDMPKKCFSVSDSE